MTREEAIKALKDIYEEAVIDDGICYVTAEDKEPLELAISALEKQTNTAKWIWKEGRMGIDYCHCSKCGDGQWEMEFPYCPNCGSRMKGENQ